MVSFRFASLKVDVLEVTQFPQDKIRHFFISPMTLLLQKVANNATSTEKHDLMDLEALLLYS